MGNKTNQSPNVIGACAGVALGVIKELGSENGTFLGAVVGGVVGGIIVDQTKDQLTEMRNNNALSGVGTGFVSFYITRAISALVR